MSAGLLARAFKGCFGLSFPLSCIRIHLLFKQAIQEGYHKPEKNLEIGCYGMFSLKEDKSYFGES